MDTVDITLESYFNTIIEVLKRRVEHQNHSLDSSTIRGFDIIALEQMVRDELALHIADRKAHDLSYSDIGAMSKSNILGKFGSMQNATLIPISTVPSLTNLITPNWTDNRVTIQGFNFMFNGMDYQMPSKSVTLDQAAISYLVILPDTKMNVNNTIISTADGQVIPHGIHVAHINKTTKVISSRAITRVGLNHLSKTVSGGGVPVSEGVPYNTGTLNNGWK